MKRFIKSCLESAKCEIACGSVSSSMMVTISSLWTRFHKSPLSRDYLIQIPGKSCNVDKYKPLFFRLHESLVCKSWDLSMGNFFFYVEKQREMIKGAREVKTQVRTTKGLFHACEVEEWREKQYFAHRCQRSQILPFQTVNKELYLKVNAGADLFDVVSIASYSSDTENTTNTNKCCFFNWNMNFISPIQNKKNVKSLQYSVNFNCLFGNISYWDWHIKWDPRHCFQWIHLKQAKRGEKMLKRRIIQNWRGGQNRN